MPAPAGKRERRRRRRKGEEVKKDASDVSVAVSVAAISGNYARPNAARGNRGSLPVPLARSAIPRLRRRNLSPGRRKSSGLPDQEVPAS